MPTENDATQKPEENTQADLEIEPDELKQEETEKVAGGMMNSDW
jgi:hypothetical protein